jgi:hypothetical protein
MRQEATLATAVVVVLLSGILSAGAMLGAFKDKDGTAVVTLDTTYGAPEGGTQARAGQLGGKASKTKKGSPAPAAAGPATTAGSPGSGVTATAGVSDPGAGSTASGSGAASGS